LAKDKRNAQDFSAFFKRKKTHTQLENSDIYKLHEEEFHLLKYKHEASNQRYDTSSGPSLIFTHILVLAEAAYFISVFLK